MDERPQRHVLPGRHLAPLFPIQPVRLHVGQHDMGTQHQHRPRALEARTCSHRTRRPRLHLQRFRRGRPPEHRRLRPGRHHRVLYLGQSDALGRQPVAKHGIQHRRRAHLHQVCRQPRHHLRPPRLPRPQGLLVRSRPALVHDIGRGTTDGNLLIPQSPPMEKRKLLRPETRRARRCVGMSRPGGTASRRHR